MTIKKMRIKSVELTPENIEGGGGTDFTRDGELGTDSSDSELKVRLGGDTKTVVTEDQTQILTNKTIDADLNTISDLEVDNLKSGVLNVSTTLSGASDTQLPSALAVKTYIDDKAAAQNEASEISVTPAGTISATNVQAALVELDTDIQNHLNDTAGAHAASAISNSPTGNLTSTDVQDALNELQTDADDNYNAITAHVADTVDAHDASAISVVPTGNLAATEVQAALVELQTDIDNINTASGTLTNKNLDDSTVSFVDTADITKKISFDAIGTTGTKTTIASSQTANRTITLPDATTDMVGHNNTQTIANKSFNDNSNFFVDNIDPTKKIGFDAAGSASTTTTIASSQTANRTITLPDASGTVVSTSSLTSGRIPYASTNSQLLDASDFTLGTNFIKLANTKHIEIAAADDAATTGANASLAAFNAGALRLTNVSLTSLANIPAGADGQELILFNRTGVSVSVVDSVGAIGTAANRIFTGTGANITFAANAALYLKYDSTSARWQIIGGSGSGGASALSSLTDVTITSVANEQYLVYDSASSKWVNRPVVLEEGSMMRQLFNYAQVSDFTQTGLSLSSTNPIHGLKSALLTSAGVTQNFKQVIAVDREFRGKNLTLQLYARSSATQGNVTILIYDETNAVNIAASQPITLGSTTVSVTTNTSTSLTGISSTDINLLRVGQSITGTGFQAGTVITAISTSSATISLATTASATVTAKISALPARQAFTFDIPANCASLSYTISALAETGSPESYFDDISIKLTEVARTTASISDTVFNTTEWAAYTPTFTGFGTVTGIEFEWRQIGSNYEIRGKFANGTSTATEARVSLPFSATSAGTAIIPSIHQVGTYAYGVTSTNAHGGFVLIEPSVGYVTFSGNSIFGSGSNNPLTKSNANSLVVGGAGEIISLYASVPIAGLTASTIVSKTIDLTSAQLVQQVDSEIKVEAANGYGSTNTRIPRFLTIVKNIGSDIRYTDDAALGASFTVLKAGTYMLEGVLASGAGAMIGGASINSTQLTTNVDSITNTDRLASSRGGAANDPAVFSKTFYANAGDVIRPHADATALSTSAYFTWFSLAKIGTLSQLNFSNDSKIIIPTHQLRFEGASSRGATDTAIVKFDTQAITQGDGFDVANTAANGTVITVKKAGKLSVSCSMLAALGNQIAISKNQTGALSSFPSVASEIMATNYANVQSRLMVASTFDVVVNDVIRIAATLVSASDVGNSLQLSLTENSIPANFSNVLPQWSQSDSSVRLNTIAAGVSGYGSTNTAIRRFTNTVDNLGTAITYSDSATLGASFLINEDGLYNISYTDSFSTGLNLGLSRNSSQLTTAIQSISVSNRLNVVNTQATNTSDTVSWSGYLFKNDIIRPHSDTSPTTGDGARAQFTISKVGKPNLSSVDVTSFVNLKTIDTEAIEALTATTTFGATNTGVPVLNITRNTNLGIIRVDSSAANGTSFVALKNCTLNIQATVTCSSQVYAFLTRNATVLNLGTNDGVFAQTVTIAGVNTSFNSSISLNVGDVIRVQRNNAGLTGLAYLAITATADNNATASPTQQVSSDTMSFAFKATAIDPNVDPVGTFNTYTYAANTNTPTIAGTAPTQTTSSMNVNGVQVFGRAYNATSTSASPARVDVFIGKGLKSYEVLGYATLAKVNPVSMDSSIYSTVNVGIMKDYDEVTGILKIMSPTDHTLATTSYRLITSATGATTTSGYFVFNASRAPVLTTIPNLQQRVAYLSDVKASGTSGGGTTATTYVTRTLNTIVDSTGIVSSLSSNQFTLNKGVYFIEAIAPAAGILNGHRARLRNITDSTTSLLGSSQYNTVSTVSNPSTISGEVTITSAKVFEIQHYSTLTVAASGFGVNVSSGESEIYTQVKIIKIKD
jgi:hypothetical protein